VSVLLVPIILAAVFALLFAMAGLEPESEPEDPSTDLAAAQGTFDTTSSP